MSHLSDYAAGLVEEVLGEMAQSFFGSRRQLDDLLERFANLAHELRKKQEEVIGLGSGLLALLPGEKGRQAFEDALGVSGPGVVLPMVPCPLLPVLHRIPFGLTLAGRYTRIILNQYDAYQQAVHAYMHGVALAHPDDPRRKVMSLHRSQLKTFADRINQAIEKRNADMPVSCIIRYASGFADPGMADKERIVGSHCPYPGKNQGGTSLDADYAYHFIDFDAYGLTAFAELPKANIAAKGIARMCRELVKTEKATVAETMIALKKALV